MSDLHSSPVDLPGKIIGIGDLTMMGAKTKFPNLKQAEVMQAAGERCGATENWDREPMRGLTEDARDRLKGLMRIATK